MFAGVADAGPTAPFASGPGSAMTSVHPARDGRVDAVRAASRHTVHVRWLRRSIVAACLGGGVLLAAISLFDPFGGRAEFSAESKSLNGSRIIKEKPRLSGYRDDGRPYDLSAAQGAQDIRSPNVVELSEIDARIDSAEQSDVHLTAPAGTFDGANDTMNLNGDIRIIGESRFDIRLREAKMNFKTGTVVSDQAISVAMPSGVIAAQRLIVSENGKKITFYGGVETTFTPAAPPEAPRP